MIEPTPLETDDALRQYRRVFLGPQGHTFPVHASFKAWGVFGALTGLGLFIVIAIFRQPFTMTLFMNVAATTVLLTYLLMRWVDYDTPLRALPRMGRDLVLRRSPNQSTTTKLDISRVRFVRDPWDHGRSS